MKSVKKQNVKRSLLQFSSNQMNAIQKGELMRESLLKAAKKAAEVNIKSPHPHTYLYSPAGLGKTYNVMKAVTKAKRPYRLISGNNSLWSFAIDIMNIHATKPANSKFIIIVDDCDALLESRNLDTMKNVLSGNKILSYQAQLAVTRLDPDTQANLPRYQTSGRLGFEVPCDDFVFIFCSNFRLPFDDETSKVQAKGISKAAKRMNGLSAIRSRLNTKDFDMDWQTQWGWIATVVIKDGALNELNIDSDSQMILLDWMYHNWNLMKETNIRTTIKMAQIMIEEHQYKTIWETDFLK